MFFSFIVTQCVNRIGLLGEARLIDQIFFGTRAATATSSSSPHVPTEAYPSGLGWCSDFTTCTHTGNDYIEVNFTTEVVVEAISMFGAAGSYVTQYSVEYARSNREFNCFSEQESNQTVSSEYYGSFFSACQFFRFFLLEVTAV